MLKLQRTWSGRIRVPFSCEINVVDHCNKSCLDCNHAAPALRPWFADPEVIERDVRILSRYYRAPVIKLMGGEPLLHPELPVILKLVRRSNIANSLLLLTNGTFPERMTTAVWCGIDQVEISIYPDSKLDRVTLAHYKAQATRFGKILRIVHYQRFRTTFALRGNDDTTAVRQIYSTCRLANVWGCHSIYDGHLYRCPQSIYIPRLVVQPTPDSSDGLPILDAQLRQSLHDYLSSPEPLWSCRYCLGTTGLEREHRMVLPKQWRSYHL